MTRHHGDDPFLVTRFPTTKRRTEAALQSGSRNHRHETETDSLLDLGFCLLRLQSTNETVRVTFSQVKDLGFVNLVSGCERGLFGSSL